MDLQRARETPIHGYVHPKSTNVNRDSQYKTFTEGNKKFGITTVGKQYSKYDNNEESNITCPKCNLPVLEICPCAFNDKKCSSGHIWYTNRDGKMKIGNPHNK